MCVGLSVSIVFPLFARDELHENAYTRTYTYAHAYTRTNTRTHARMHARKNVIHLVYPM